jgi:hypothetical protein
MKNIRFVILLIGLVMLISCGMLLPRKHASGFYSIIAADKNNSADARWASYLCKHLDKRCSESEAVKVCEKASTGQKQLFRIIIHEDSLSSKDYYIKYTDKEVTLSARNDEQMTWLMYQFMGMLGLKDHRFDVSDLPPAICDFGQDQSGNFAFEYRSVYMPSNNNPELFPITGVGNIDYDWALWGHNLHKILDQNTPGIYATVDGSENQDQYCFSSPNLYNAVVKYILTNYGDHNKSGMPVRFVIMPNDNDIVCQCSSCRAKGNTRTSATPAVTSFIEKLAKRFPDFLFFTSYYQTTATLPTQKFGKNVGVLISTMDLPMVSGFDRSKKGEFFANLFRQWGKLCSHVYVWDYCRNFDDYFTPFPFLEIARERLLFYQKYGVKGVIFNGSGSDYACFDDMQTYVLSRLLINPNTDVKEGFDRFFHIVYPESGPLLASYYEAIERRCNERKVPLQIYGGIEDAIKEYLVPNEFTSFCKNLDNISKHIKGGERTRLNRLLTALNFTQIELTRTPYAEDGENKDVSIFLENLKGHTAFTDMSNYREANGNLNDYINYMSKHKISHSENNGDLLTAKTFKVRSLLDEGSKPISILTDGYWGIPYDYHTGWLIVTSDTLSVEFSAGNVSHGVLKIGFLNANKWHLVIPQSVSVWQKGKKISEVRPLLDDESPFQRVVVSVNVNRIEAKYPVRLVLTKSNNKMAVDEVELFKK